MSKLFHLVLNENMKIMYRPRLWLMIVILVASVFCVAVFVSNGEQNADQKTDLWGFVTTCTVLLFIVQIFSVIIAGDIVASEFSWGTIKLLLIRPANRTKILISKYLTVIVYALLFTSVLFLSSLLLGVLFFHNQPSFDQNLFTPSKTICIYLLRSVRILMDVTFAFMLSTVFRSSSLAIGLSIFLLFAGNALVELLGHFDISWGRYLLYANSDLTQYLSGNQVLFKEMTLGFSIAMLAIYFILFNLLSWLCFIKRDIEV